MKMEMMKMVMRVRGNILVEEREKAWNGRRKNGRGESVKKSEWVVFFFVLWCLGVKFERGDIGS